MERAGSRSGSKTFIFVKWKISLENSFSEILSLFQEGNKTKFHFDTPHACMVFSRGELTLIEYGVNAILERLRFPIINVSF